MNILFTKNNSFVSKNIRAVTGEPVSHVALDFGLFVVHSNFLGLHLEWAKNFRKKSDVVYSLRGVDSLEETDQIGRLNTLLEQYEFSMYDVGAMFFIGVCVFLRNKFNIPLPKSNLWQISGMFICTEWVTKFIDGTEESMMTPFKLYLRLKQTGKWVDC